MTGRRPTGFEKLDGLCPFILLSHVILLNHVVLDLLIALDERLQLQQNPLSEVCDAGGGSWLSVWQVDVDHEDVREHTGRIPNQRG